MNMVTWPILNKVMLPTMNIATRSPQINWCGVTVSDYFLFIYSTYSSYLIIRVYSNSLQFNAETADASTFPERPHEPICSVTNYCHFLSL